MPANVTEDRVALASLATVELRLDDKVVAPFARKNVAQTYRRNASVLGRAGVLPISGGGIVQVEYGEHDELLEAHAVGAEKQVDEQSAGDVTEERERGDDDDVLDETSTDKRSATVDVTLDGFLVLEAAYAELPEEVESADLSSHRIKRVEPGDMHYFSNLRWLDVSDNNLEAPLAHLSRLPSVQTLKVSCNNMSRLVPDGESLGPGALESLAVLDVSFNRLKNSAIDVLSTLPSLRELVLRGNDITSLQSSDSVSSPSGFPSLVKLDAGENRLTPTALLHACKFPRLSELLLDSNPIAYVPKLVPVADSALEILSLGNCKVAAELDFVNVSDLKHLKRVMLWGNPVARKTRSGGENVLSLPREVAAGADARPIHVYLRGEPAPPKPSVVDVLKAGQKRMVGPDGDLNLFPQSQALHFGTGYMSAGATNASYQTAADRLQEMFDTLSSAYSGVEMNENEQEADADARIDTDIGTAPSDDFVVEDEALDSEILRMTKFERSRPPLPGGDATAALNALKFALAHPISDLPPEFGGDKMPKYAQPTISTSIRRTMRMEEYIKEHRSRFSEANEVQVATRAERVQAIEGMLATMREKLAHIQRGLLHRSANDAISAQESAERHAGASAVAVQPGLE